MKKRLVFFVTFFCFTSSQGDERDLLFKPRTYTCQVNVGQYWPGALEQGKAPQAADRLYIRTEEFKFQYAGNSIFRVIALQDFTLRWNSQEQVPFKAEMARGYDLANLKAISLEMQNSLVLNAEVSWNLPGYGEAPLVLSSKGVAEGGRLRLAFNFTLPHAKSTVDSRYSKVHVLIDCLENELNNEHRK